MTLSTIPASLLCLLVAAGALACATRSLGPGTWAAVTSSETCPGCETRIGFDLQEHSTGLITGMVGTYTQGGVERLEVAAWVTGLRVGDSLLLTFVPSCPLSDQRVSQGFRGLLGPDGELRGVLWGRDAGIVMYDLNLELRRGAIDPLVLASFAGLRAPECAGE